MTGKEKCKILKEIRREIAEKNDIEWIVSECGHKGECKGTCPHCESEVRKLERELEIRRRLGKTVALVGISAACMAALAACRPLSLSRQDPGGIVNSGGGNPGGGQELSGAVEVLDGEVALPDPDEEDPQGGSDDPYDELSGYVGGCI